MLVSCCAARTLKSALSVKDELLKRGSAANVLVDRCLAEVIRELREVLFAKLFDLQTLRSQRWFLCSLTFELSCPRRRAL